MEFKLSKEQDAIQKAAREFAKKEFDKETALQHEKDHTFPRDIWKKACDLGFIGIHYPEAYGGQEYGILENTLVIESFCRQDSGIGIALSLADFCSEIILRNGNHEQKTRYLTPLATGGAISSAAFTEPNHGSDITVMDTVAQKQGDDYIINGQKIFITNGTISDFVLVLCQTDTEVSPPYRGQSIIIVDTSSPGFSAADVGEKMGIKMSPTAELAFTDVRVPCTNLIGEENKGFYYSLAFFNESRLKIASQGIGIAQGAFDRGLAYVKQRTQFGKKLAQFQVNRHKLADMAVQIEAARLLTYKAAWQFDQKDIDPKMSSMAKMFAGRTAVCVTDEVIQMMGGYGYMLEYEVERFYRDARITEIYEGTREIQKNTIASVLLGKD